MTISRQEIQHIALLSRLDLTESEIEQFTDQLSEILDYAAQLNQLDTTHVEPTFHAVPLENIFHPDEVGQPLSLDEALQNAPKRSGHFFEVPKVADGS